MNRLSLPSWAMASRFILICIAFLPTLVYGAINLMNTERPTDHESIDFDCLYYYHYDQSNKYLERTITVEDLIPYCRRPLNRTDIPMINDSTARGTNISFDELKLLNITSLDLLSWSLPIDLSERYNIYLKKSSSEMNEYFLNCSQPWFGLQCEYSFENESDIFIQNIVYEQILSRPNFTEKNFTDVTDVELSCYTFIECNHTFPSLCLDWREICNGIVECTNDGVDEKFCFEMEINECQEGEYRCYNGQCISGDLWEDGQGEADCTDRSDRTKITVDNSKCHANPSFQCEENSCLVKNSPFPCGDGQCVEYLSKCNNGRHLAIFQSFLSRGNLNVQCWMAMVCIFNLIEEINGTSCQQLRINESLLRKHLDDCDGLYFFPSNFVGARHLRLLYNGSFWKSKLFLTIIPDYICFNRLLCDFIQPIFDFDGLSCFKPEAFGPASFNPPYGLYILLLRKYYPGCLLREEYREFPKLYHDYQSIYSCENSSKMINKNKLVDGISDCPSNDDEKYPDSCQLLNPYRILCESTNQCVSPINGLDLCDNEELATEIIPFEKFCNRIISIDYLPKGENISLDESFCGSSWPCNNIYTRCDGFWNCPNGEDEIGCFKELCDSSTFACLSPSNFSLICLPPEKVADKNDDCLARTDELQKCYFTHESPNHPSRYYCNNSRICIPLATFYTSIDQCQPEIDQTSWLKHSLDCRKEPLDSRSEFEQILCGITEKESNGYHYFSIHSCSDYPIFESEVSNHIFDQITQQPLSIIPLTQNSPQYEWSSYCNRGLMVRIAYASQNNDRGCLCPPSYFGDRCQYQNQRVGVTLKLYSTDRSKLFAIIIMLIDDDDPKQQVQSHEQILYSPQQDCLRKINRYLLFPTRPKDLLKNYSVKILAFEKHNLMHVGSWHYELKFPFLPVQRVSVSLSISIRAMKPERRCLKTCKHGTCVKYMNKDEYYCHCFSAWSGIYCDIPIQGHSCSTESITLPSLSTKSVCVCPINQHGLLCSFPSICPPNACKNGGECVSADLTIPGQSYHCLCPEEFFGTHCEHTRIQMTVSLVNINVPRYITGLFIITSKNSRPKTITMLQKLTLFQTEVTFRISHRFHVLILHINQITYLAAIQNSPRAVVRTIVSPDQQCLPIQSLFNTTIMKLRPEQRIVLYHDLCKFNSHLKCFHGDGYFCLCTNESHANCMKYPNSSQVKCSHSEICENSIECIQDDLYCAAKTLCVCEGCFFGDRCQFYAKGLGSTLDEILGYEIKKEKELKNQPITVQISSIITVVMFCFGFMGAILCILIFSRKRSQEIGCGVYLVASSMSSLLAVTLFAIKLWLLLLSQQDFQGKQFISYVNCLIVEPLLKMTLYMDNWFNACVATERAFSVVKGINFDKPKSKRIAKWVTGSVVLIITGLYCPQLTSLEVFHDAEEKRAWCVVAYKYWINLYSTTFIFFHYFAPLLINILSGFIIIIATARLRVTAQNKGPFIFKFLLKLKKYKHLLISPAIIVLLTSPYLIVSIKLDCNKSSYMLWFNLMGYFLSFIPAISIFIIFVVPSPFYRQELKRLIAKFIRRCRAHQRVLKR